MGSGQQSAPSPFNCKSTPPVDGPLPIVTISCCCFGKETGAHNSGRQRGVVSVSKDHKAFHDACRPFERKLRVPSSFNFW